jgi:hypothetical protein
MKVGLTLVRGLSRVNRVALADLFEPRLCVGWIYLVLNDGRKQCAEYYLY